MRIAGVVHFYPPWRCAGSETVAHELFKAAVQAGHEVRVWVTNQDSERSWRGTEPDTELDGVQVTRVRNVIVGRSAVMRWKPDVILSHHDHSVFAIKTAKVIGARSVFMTHNSYDINARPMRAQPDLVIHNTNHVAETLNTKFGEPKEWMMFHPPVTPDRHKVSKTGDAITLINLNRDKGSDLFYDLAARMPEREFLGVVGGHGVQVIKRGLPNVTIAEHNPDMRPVWESTRILLMPSIYESYGLVAVEAGLNGIPTIANPTPGLLENMGKGGIFAERDNPDVWVKYLELMDDQNYYRAVSDYARNRADEAMKKTSDTLNRWVDWIG